MRSSRRFVIVGALVLAGGVVTVQAEDPCKAKCDAWIASCNQACGDAPIVDECKANCRIAYGKCMSDCGLSPSGRGTQLPSDSKG